MLQNANVEPEQFQFCITQHRLAQHKDPSRGGTLCHPYLCHSCFGVCEGDVSCGQAVLSVCKELLMAAQHGAGQYAEGTLVGRRELEPCGFVPSLPCHSSAAGTCR